MSSLGKNFRITIFGASHGEAIGVVMEGLPRGLCHRYGRAQRLPRAARARGAGRLPPRGARPMRPLFLSGMKNGVTCGGAVTAVIRNGDAHPGDYDALRNTPRPGHADFAARMKDGDAVDLSGGGRFSGRLTAPLCVAGGIAHAASGRGKHPHRFAHRLHCRYRGRGHLPGVHAGKTVPDAQRSARRGDARCHCKGHAPTATASAAWWSARWLGLPAGLGDALFDGVESRLSAALFGIPAVKGVEFGRGVRRRRVARQRE